MAPVQRRDAGAPGSLRQAPGSRPRDPGYRGTVPLPGQGPRRCSRPAAGPGAHFPGRRPRQPEHRGPSGRAGPGEGEGTQQRRLGQGRPFVQRAEQRAFLQPGKAADEIPLPGGPLEAAVGQERQQVKGEQHEGEQPREKDPGPGPQGNEAPAGGEEIAQQQEQQQQKKEIEGEIEQPASGPAATPAAIGPG